MKRNGYETLGERKTAFYEGVGKKGAEWYGYIGNETVFEGMNGVSEERGIMVRGGHKYTIECRRGGIATVKTYLSVWGDRAETSGATLFQTNGKLSEAAMTEPGAFLLAAQATQGEQGIKYLFLDFFEESVQHPLV